MPNQRRRQFVGALCGLFSISGCQGLPAGGGNETENATNDEGSSPRNDDSDSDSGTATETPESTPSNLSDLDRECVTADFDGYTGTTPVAPPSGPATLNAESAADYAADYEQYYQRYAALYEIGAPTPADANAPAHGFPEVELRNASEEVLSEANGGWTVRLQYDLAYETHQSGGYEVMGERTVTYFISDEHVVRAEENGRVEPGPDPLEVGTVMSC